jgi:hypothetical protein
MNQRQTCRLPYPRNQTKSHAVEKGNCLQNPQTYFAVHYTNPAGILEYKCFFYIILYVIILFDIEIDIKIGFIFCVETVFL